MKPRLRFIMAANWEYKIYLERMKLRPDQARLLTKPEQLHGIGPDSAEIFVLPTGKQEIGRPLLGEMDHWNDRWRGLGIYAITQDELDGGIPARQVRLLADYDRILDEARTDYFSQSQAREWLTRLSDQDADLLLAATEARRKAQKEARKKIQKVP